VSAQVPPNDLEAERVVLSAVILDRDAFDLVDPILTTEQFYSDCNRLVYSAVVDLSAKGKPRDIEAVAGWLRDRSKLDQVGGLSALIELINATEAVAHVLDYARRIVEKAQLRRIIAEARVIIAEAYQVTDVKNFAESVESRIYDATKSDSREDQTVSLGVATGAFIAQLKDPDKPKGLSTGFRQLDQLLGGGFFPGVYVAAGRPGMGKTSFATGVMQHFASHAPRDKRGVLFLSIEMTRQQILSRLFAADAMVDTRAMRSGRINAEEWARVAASAEKLSKLPLLINDASMFSVGSVRGAIRRAIKTLKRDHGTGLGLVAIDYLQLMQAPELGPRANRNDVVTHVMAGLRCASKDYQIPILALSQLSRDCEKRPDKRPVMSDLRDSGTIEQDADTILLLYRADKYRKRGEAPSRDAEIIVGKARDGCPDTVIVNYVDYCTKFIDPMAGYDQFDDFGEAA
jgi:replicative DNA helicase